MAEVFNLLIAEDDQILATSIKLMVPSGFKVFIATCPEEVPDQIFFHAALVDMHLRVRAGETPDGPNVIAQILRMNPQTEIVSMSGHLDRANMELAIRAGAARFLAKPLSADEVKLVLEKILAYWQLRHIEKSPLGNFKLIGQSPSMELLKKTIATLKNELAPVLIEGETGTGKEVVARFLNQQEGQRPFISINCAALNENLFESEFFGHLKGSFTGADTNKVGLAEAAHGGDLFLDEIEALPLSLQAKLLRFLESGEIRKVGAKENQIVQTRVIAASNQPLKQLIQEKKFREDLYFRLASRRIEIPPLRERLQDIPALCEFFLSLERPRRNKSFDPEGLQLMQKYSWPGNIRELKRICEQLILTSPLPIIRGIDVRKVLPPVASENFEAEMTEVSDESLEAFLQIQEKSFIERALQRWQSIELTATQLKVSKSNLYKKIKDYGIIYE
jgi:DNA-binding NtrC family response regulator